MHKLKHRMNHSPWMTMSHNLNHCCLSAHHQHPTPPPLHPVTPGEPELATHSEHQLPKREHGTMGSPSTSWHDIKIAPPQPENLKPPMSPMKMATPCHSQCLAGLPTKNDGFESTANYANSLCNSSKKQCWENLCAHFVTTSAPPTSCHEEFACAGKAQANKNPDAQNWKQAMASLHHEQFFEAADVEIKELTEHNTWIKDSMGNATNKTVPSQWVFQVKQFKAHLVLRRDPQKCEGETFSPAAAWSTVRPFLIMCTILNWDTLTITFSNAFMQSDLLSKADKAQLLSMPNSSPHQSSGHPPRLVRTNKHVSLGWATRPVEKM